MKRSIKKTLYIQKFLTHDSLHLLIFMKFSFIDLFPHLTIFIKITTQKHYLLIKWIKPTKTIKVKKLTNQISHIVK